MSLKEKLKLIESEEQQTELAQLLKETRELNNLMRSYIGVQMDRETVSRITVDKELTEIRDTSEKVQAEMISVLAKQEKMLMTYGQTLLKILAVGEKEMKKNNQEIITRLNEIEKTLYTRKES